MIVATYSIKGFDSYGRELFKWLYDNPDQWQEDLAGLEEEEPASEPSGTVYRVLAMAEIVYEEDA